MFQIPDDIAEAAKSSQRKWGVPAAVSLAQWRIESGNGTHSPGNNPFGMKPRKGMNDPQQMLMTTEWSKARGYYKVPQPFRVFPSVAAAFDAHAELLATAPVYASAFAALPDVDGFIDRLAAHYATDPLYASKIKSMIRQSDLAQYDEVSA